MIDALRLVAATSAAVVDDHPAFEEPTMFRYVAALFVFAGLVSGAGCAPSETPVPIDEELIAAPEVVSLPEELLPAAAAAALEQGTEFELLSLEPNGGEETEGENRFYGFEILGALAIDDRITRDELVVAFKRGIADNVDREAAACFAPRHGIRVTHDGKVHEFVICFECYITTWYVDGERGGNVNPTNVGQPEFDRVLKGAGIRLPKPAGP
jgi:hypothetical protein